MSKAQAFIVIKTCYVIIHIVGALWIYRLAMEIEAMHGWPWQ